MEYRQLGRTGLSLSAVGFGCGALGGLLVRGERDAQREAVEAALAGGINYFDTAAQYGDGRSEENLGRVLRELGASPHVGTKLRLEGHEVGDAQAIVRSKLEAGLRRLGLERVDVCTLHTRIGTGPEELSATTVLGPVVEALRGLVAAGLAGAVGFTGLGDSGGILAAARAGRFDTFQCYFNVLNQSAARPGSPDGVAQDFAGVLQVASTEGLAAFGIRPLAAGALGGTKERHALAGGAGRPMAIGEEYEEDLRRSQVLSGQLASLGASDLPELALRFALGERRLSSVLVGFSDRTQVETALRAESLGPLPPDAVDRLVAAERVV